VITPTPLQWEAYRLTHPDHEGLSTEEAAEKMRVTEYRVKEMLRHMKLYHPTLFTDISSDGRRPAGRRGVSRFGSWCDGNVKKRF